MDRQWHIEAEVAPGIDRIRAGEETAWFLPDESALAESAVREARGGSGSPVVAATGPDGRSVRGVSVPRMEGGLLVDVLRACGGLTSGQTIGVLRECLAALAEAPAAPPGRIRLHRELFALDTGGTIRTIPCHTVPAGAVEPQVELGEIGYLCLTGRTWTEAATPVRDLRHAPSEPLAAIVIELLENATELDLDVHGLPGPLPARLSAAGAPEPFPFLPAEAAVPVSDSVTAQIRIDAGYVDRLAAAAAARTARSRTGRGDGAGGEDRGAGGPDAGGPDAGGARSRRRTGTAAEAASAGGAATGQDSAPSGVGRLRRAAGRGGKAGRSGTGGLGKDGGRGRGPGRRTTRGRQARAGAAGPRERIAAILDRVRRLGWRPLAAVGALLAVVIGILVLVPALGPEQRTATGPSAPPRPAASSAPSTPAGPATTEAPAPDSSDPPTAPPRTAPPGSAGATAPELLDREDPFAAFRALTEARAAAHESGDTAALTALTVPGSPAARADARALVEASTGGTVTIALELIGEPESDGETARFAARMHTTATAPDGTAEDYGTVRIRVELRYGADGWRVYRITDGNAAGAG